MLQQRATAAKSFTNRTNSKTCGKISGVDSFNITINRNVIKQVTVFKYLGVVLDECLTCNAYLKISFRGYGKRLGMLKRTGENVRTRCANTIYKSFIPSPSPIRVYCDTVRDCCGKGNIHLIEELYS